MKSLVFALLLSMAASAAPVILYDNGFNGSNAADGIGSAPGPGAGSIADSFVISAPSTAGAVTFYSWILRDPLGRDFRLTSVDWAITTGSFSGATLASGTTDPGDQFLFTNGSGQDIYAQSFAIPALALNPGTYFLQLSNARNAFGFAGYWDVSGGASSSARQGIPGNIPSHSFQIADSLAVTAVPELDASQVLLPLSCCLVLVMLQRRRTSTQGLLSP